MMDADIEHLVLSGKLFGTHAGDASPERTPSPTLSFASSAFDDDEHDDLVHVAPSDAADSAYESIGMGPGRTGVKGVLRDQQEAQAIEAARRERDLEGMRRRMARGDLGGKTFLEEAAQEKLVMDGDGDDVAELGLAGGRMRRDVWGRPKEGPFGHLREVGRAGFVAAVEREDRGVWVVVHLYESSLDRCFALDDTLSKLARLYPQTKFLRARAAALGFASKGTSRKRYATARTQNNMPGRYVDDEDEDDPYAEGGDNQDAEKTPYNDDDDDDEREEDVDTDMLPTLLVYRGGELVHNWVRVDWEAGDAGIEELLSRRHIIAGVPMSNGNCGLPEDDSEDDLVWGDEETSP